MNNLNWGERTRINSLTAGIQFMFGASTTLLWAYCTVHNWGTADALINGGVTLAGLAGLALRSWAVPAALAGAFIGGLFGVSIPHRAYTPAVLGALLALSCAWVAWDLERCAKERTKGRE